PEHQILSLESPTVITHYRHNLGNLWLAQDLRSARNPFYVREHPPHPDSQRIELSDHFETVARVVGDIGLGRGLQVHAVEVGAPFHQFAQMIENRNSAMPSL